MSTIHRTYEYTGGECEEPWYERVYVETFWGAVLAREGKLIKPGRRKVIETWRTPDGQKMGRWYYEQYDRDGPLYPRPAR